MAVCPGLGDLRRFTVQLGTGGQYNLIINNTRMQDAGIYACYDAAATTSTTEQEEVASAVFGVVG